MSAWQPGCWHRLFPPETVERFYREKERKATRPAVTMDRFACPALREPAEEAAPPAARPDALEEVVAVIVERLLPAVVPRLVEMLLPALEKRLAVQAAKLVVLQMGNGHERQGRS